MHRRSAPRVRDGRVQKKNNWAPSADDYRAVRPSEIRFERVKPADGYRHLVTKDHVRRMLELLPDWNEIAVGVRAIELSSDTDSYGWYQAGVVALCNWDANLWALEPLSFVEENADLLEALGVEHVPVGESEFLTDYNEFMASIGRPPREPTGTARELRWTEEQARAFLLLDVLPHELGHHHDRMTNRGRRVARGEPYAIEYARRACRDALAGVRERVRALIRRKDVTNTSCSV